MTHKTHWDYLIDWVPNLASLEILDLGSGKGAFLLHAAIKGANIAGVETNETYIQTAQDRLRSAGQHVQITQGKGENLPFPDASFDFINICEVIEHVEDPQQLLREAYRVLRPDGRMYLSVPNRFGLRDQHFHLYLVNWLPRAWADTFITLFGKHKDYADRSAGYQRLADMHYFTYGAFKRLARNAGFAVYDMRELRLQKGVSWPLRWFIRRAYLVVRHWYFDSFHLLLARDVRPV